MLRYLRYAFGSSRVANSAYQNWPTQGPDSCPILNEVRISTAPIRSLIISRDENHPNASDHLLYPAQLKVPGYPERNFGGNQLLDGSMSLSPLYLDLTSDLHVSIHRTSTKVSPGFLRPRKRSLSFGTQQVCSASDPFHKRSGPSPAASRKPELTGLAGVTFIAHHGLSPSYSHTW